MNNRKLNEISNIKAIMMFLIILYHCIAIWMPDGWFTVRPGRQNVILSSAAQWLDLIHIYVFTFASGYIYSVMRFERNHYSSLKIFLSKKVNRLVVPYIFASVIWVIPFDILFYKSSFRNIIYKYLLAYSPSQLWYLIMLFVVFMIVYISGDIFYNMNCLKIFCVFVICELSYTIIGKYISMPFQLLAAIKFLPYFVWGMNEKSINRIFNSNVCSKTIIFLIHVSSFVVYMSVYGDGLFFKIMNLVAATICSVTGIIVVFVVYNKVKDNKLLLSRFFNEFKANSFQMYLFHQQVIWCVLYKFYEKIPLFVVVLLSIVLSFGVSLALSELLKKNKYLKKCLG